MTDLKAVMRLKKAPSDQGLGWRWAIRVLPFVMAGIGAQVAGTTLAMADSAVPPPQATAASVGAGVGASPIVLDKPAAPGQSYVLPALYVVNTGNTPATFRVTVTRLSTGAERIVPSDWVVIGANDFDLAGNQSVTVPLHLRVPSGAVPGAYMTNLVAGTISRGAQAGGATFGAAAATKLNFSVAAASGTPFVLPAWLPIGLATVVLGVILIVAARLSRIRIEVRRR